MIKEIRLFMNINRTKKIGKVLQSYNAKVGDFINLYLGL